jgi:non-specific protein-tyrosine kinase
MAEAYQAVRSAVQFSLHGHDANAIVITSPKRGDGRTTTAVNLSLALARVERKVVLADTDFQRPQLHSIFGTDLTPGITDALVESTPVAGIAIKRPDLAPTLAVLAAGTAPPDPAAVVASVPFRLLLTDLEMQCDLTIIDAPPVIASDDAVAVAAQVGGVVLVVRAGRTKRNDLVRAVARIEESGAALLGVVVNGVKDNGKRARPATPAGGHPLPPRQTRLSKPVSGTQASRTKLPPIEYVSPNATAQHQAITMPQDRRRLTPSR